MLGLSHSVQNRARFPRFACCGEGLGYFEELILRAARYLLDHLRRVACIVFFEQLEHTSWVLERQVLYDFPICIGFECPGARVVRTCVRIVTGEQPIQVTRTLEILPYHETRVGIVLHIILVVQFILQHVVDDAAQKRDIRACP